MVGSRESLTPGLERAQTKAVAQFSWGSLGSLPGSCGLQGQGYISTDLTAVPGSFSRRLSQTCD